MGSSISDDMPSSFARTEFLPRPERIKPPPRVPAGRLTSAESAHVLPGGSAEDRTPKHGQRYVKLKHNKQVLIVWDLSTGVMYLHVRRLYWRMF
jgi:hypothetical protein